jgi:DNA-binding transcriptional ArsR family regulator
MHNQTVKILKALADQTRLQMALELLDRDEASCQELSKKFGLSQPTLSHHYNKLIAVGIVVSRKEGAGWYYRLNRDLLYTMGINLHALNKAMQD